MSLSDLARVPCSEPSLHGSGPSIHSHLAKSWTLTPFCMICRAGGGGGAVKGSDLTKCTVLYMPTSRVQRPSELASFCGSPLQEQIPTSFFSVSNFHCALCLLKTYSSSTSVHTIPLLNRVFSTLEKFPCHLRVQRREFSFLIPLNTFGVDKHKRNGLPFFPQLC